MTSISTLLSTVVAESAEGVLDGETRSESRRRDLYDLLATPAEELAESPAVSEYLREAFPPLDAPPVDLLRRVLDEDELDAYLDRWQPGETSIAEGEMYFRPDRADLRHVAEFPRIEGVLGVSVADELDFVDGTAVLTPAAVDAVKRSVADRIAEEQRRLRTAVEARGLPRPVVESVDLDLPATFDANLGVRVVDSPSREGVDPSALGRVAARVRFDRGAGGC